MTETVESFIDEAFLKNLENFKFASKRGMKGPHRGEHKSWQSGEGIEFLDYRKYHLGDDLRYVDWSVYGRLDRLFIKLFHAEENQTVYMLLDTSRSMESGRPPKHICAKKIVAALSYICLSNLDKIGLACFSEKIDSMKPPVRGKKNYPQILSFLVSMKPGQKTAINASFLEFTALCRRRGVVIILSDLFDPNGYEAGLKALVYKRFEIHVIHVLDHEELFWSKTGNLMLTEVETGEKKIAFVDRSQLKRYRRKAEEFITGLQRFCGRYGINYYLYDTRMAFEDFLMDYFTKSSVLR
ncbi:MAG: DUF58 domain-containing protein [Deltaproteobacteria bacterium]|nr:DUF58 domain-containing protein [Deltaproteobacteria bacterium]